METLILIAVFLAITLLSEITRPKPKIENARPAGLGDFNFPTATEARVNPILFGTVVLEGPNVVWFGDLSTDAIKKSVRTGLWDTQLVTTGFKYRIGMQLGICRGEIEHLRRIWVGEYVIHNGIVSPGVNAVQINEPNWFGGPTSGGGVEASVDIYPGTTTQLVNAYLAKFQDSGAGTTRTPRYTGSCYIVVRSLDANPATSRGAYLGTSTQIAPWKFECRRLSPNSMGLSASSVNDGYDANPILVLAEVLTNTEWGMRKPTSKIDIPNFQAAGATLITEGNGFSFLLTREMPAEDLVHEIERQIYGVLRTDPATGKYQVKLFRADYDINTVPEITDADTIEVVDFARKGWNETTNDVKIKFNNRFSDYKDTFATANDAANAQMQGGGTIATATTVESGETFPGVKDPTLANAIAWRELRIHAFPFCRATLRVTRKFFSVGLGDVLAWTKPSLGFNKVAMRVQAIDYGDEVESDITLFLVQDIFQADVGAFGTPPPTSWTKPSAAVVQFPATQIQVFESPRAIVTRDPDHPGVVSNRIWCGARHQGNEASFDIRERHAAGSPAGSYAAAGDCYGFMLMGELNASLGVGSATPLSTLIITTTPDTQTDLLAAFPAGLSLTDLGVQLRTLIKVDEEFMLVTSAQASGGNVQLNGVYRACLDSVQAAHSSGAKVFLMFMGGALASPSFESSHNVDVKLVPRSLTDVAPEAGATVTSLQITDRVQRPYPPSRPSLNGTFYGGTPSLEGAGAGLDGFRVDVGLTRRDYRTTDEVQALTVDAATLFADFPAVNTTEYEVELRNDPAGTNALLFVLARGQPTFQLLRRKMIRFAASGVVPSSLRLIVRTFHDVGTTEYQSRQDLVFDFAPTSGLTGQFAFGARAANTATASYTAAATGTFTVNIGTAFSTTGVVEVSINGGAFVTVIALGLTTGTFAATSGDGIRLRHTSTDTGAETFVELKNPSAVSVAYGVLYV